MAKRVLSLVLAVLFVATISVSAFAAETPTSAVETEKAKISSDFDGDGKADWTWTLPGVIKTEKMTMGGETELNATEMPEYKPLVDKEVTVYTVKAGTKIAIKGAKGFAYNWLDYKDKKLCSLDLPDDVDHSKYFKYEIPTERKNLGGGAWTNVMTTGSYVSIIEEGYYIMAIHPFVSQYYITDKTSPDFGNRTEKKDNFFKYGYAIIHVVADEK